YSAAGPTSSGGLRDGERCTTRAPRETLSFGSRDTASGVWVQARIAATHDEAQPGQVKLPTLRVVSALTVVGEPVMAQRHTGALAVGFQRHDNTGAARR